MDFRLVVLAHCSWIDYSSLQAFENFHHIPQQQKIEKTDFRASDLTTQIPDNFYDLIYRSLFPAVIGYYNNWKLYVDPSLWPFSVQLAEFALEIGYDVLAIWLLVQLHHRHFKPRRKKKVTVTYEDEEEEESDEEHVSVYEDDATSLASGTVRHDDNQSLLG